MEMCQAVGKFENDLIPQFFSFEHHAPAFESSSLLLASDLIGIRVNNHLELNRIIPEAITRNSMERNRYI